MLSCRAAFCLSCFISEGEARTYDFWIQYLYNKKHLSEREVFRNAAKQPTVIEDYSQ